MNNMRREFLKSSSLLTTAFFLSNPFKSSAGLSMASFVNSSLHLNEVSILHTNDLHCRIDPFTHGELNNIGGLYNINSVIKANSASHILLDAGDFLDMEGSSVDHKNMIAMMNKTGYEAVTIGDKELSKGQNYFASLVSCMNFKLVNCNYEFSDPVLKSKVLPYHVIQYGEYKIGITGVGPDIRGKKYSHGIEYHQPYKKANEVAGYLKNQLNCDVVICLSHLGLEQKQGQQGNRNFAAASENIDVIISGHNKNSIHPQMILRNKQKSQVIVSNAGYGGSILGKLNLTFDKERKLHQFQCRNFIPGALANSSFYTENRKLSA